MDCIPQQLREVITYSRKKRPEESDSQKHLPSRVDRLRRDHRFMLEERVIPKQKALKDIMEPKVRTRGFDPNQQVPQEKPPSNQKSNGKKGVINYLSLSEQKVIQNFHRNRIEKYRKGKKAKSNDKEKLVCAIYKYIQRIRDSYPSDISDEKILVQMDEKINSYLRQQRERDAYKKYFNGLEDLEVAKVLLDIARSSESNPSQSEGSGHLPEYRKENDLKVPEPPLEVAKVLLDIARSSESNPSQSEGSGHLPEYRK